MLTRVVDAYLAVRRAAGFKLTGEQRLLKSFARSATRRGDSFVRTETVVAWASRAPSAPQRYIRLLTVIRFARHVRLDDPRHQVPPPTALPRVRRRPEPPYIFSARETAGLLSLALRLGPRGSIRPHAFRMLFGLLAATGMRISEALALRFEHLSADGLLVRNAKFGKDRLLPLHDTVAEQFDRYLALRQALPGDRVFITHLGRPLTYNHVNRVFRRFAKRMGIARVGPHRPRIHAFRHTFAVRDLEQCPRGRDQVTSHMLALATYLGHVNISSTYWYLQATPRLMKDISRAFESSFVGVGT